MKGYGRMEEREYIAGRRLFAVFGGFALLYGVGGLLPLEATPHYHNLMSRVWNWTEILILLLAVCFVIKTKSFRWKEAAIALLFGATCMVSMFRDPRTADIIVTSLCVTAAFYAGCRLYELAGVENVSMHTGFVGGIRYFGLGAAVSIPLAFLNLLYFSLSRQIRLGNVRRLCAEARNC